MPITQAGCRAGRGTRAIASASPMNAALPMAAAISPICSMPRNESTLPARAKGCRFPCHYAPDARCHTTGRRPATDPRQPLGRSASSSSSPRPRIWSSPADKPRSTPFERTHEPQDGGGLGGPRRRPGAGGAPPILPQLARLPDARDFADMLVALEDPLLPAIDARVAQLPLCQTTVRLCQSALQRRAQRATVIARGCVPGENGGAGHICWIRRAQGGRSARRLYRALRRRGAPGPPHLCASSVPGGTKGQGFRAKSLGLMARFGYDGVRNFDLPQNWGRHMCLPPGRHICLPPPRHRCPTNNSEQVGT